MVVGSAPIAAGIAGIDGAYGVCWSGGGDGYWLH